RSVDRRPRVCLLSVIAEGILRGDTMDTPDGRKSWRRGHGPDDRHAVPTEAPHAACEAHQDTPGASRRLPRAPRAVCLVPLLLVFAGSASPAHAQKAASATAPDALSRLNEAVDALTRKVWPSVVQILVTSYGPREDSGRSDTTAVVGRQRSIGSGYVIDADGYTSHNAP